MNAFTEPLNHDFMQRALLGCALIGFTNGFLGAFVLLRRMALMADALSHSLLPGLAVGVLLFGLTPVSVFFGALAAALLVALGAGLISRSSRIKEDVALGILYTVAFSLGIVLLSYAPSRVSLQHYLFGNILGLSDADLWISYTIALVSLPLLVFLQRPLLLLLFEPNVARSQGIRVGAMIYLLVGLVVLAMISALQAVGVVLALGLLIAPAATIYLFSDRYEWLFWGGGIVGMFGSCFGLLLSYWLNLPTGPCITLLLGLMFGFAYLFSPRYGLFPRLWRRKRHFHEESLERWHDQPPA
jgi:ABC-type Mn2+/Zn2+ transport system permease subunit